MSVSRIATHESISVHGLDSPPSRDPAVWNSLSHCDWQIFEYNGAAVVAMAGKNCVAIGSDLRLGVQFQTLACDYKKVYPIHDHLYLGLAGLGTDTQTL